MSLLKNFILKHDKPIIKALVIIITLLIPSILLLPSVIESYTYNSYLSSSVSDYIEYNESLTFLRLFSFALIVMFIIYSLLRRHFLGNTKNGPYDHKTKVWILLLMILIPTIALNLINSHYEDKNNEFITSKLIDVKNSIIAGKCSLEKTKDSSVSYGMVSDCGTVKEKMPGDLWFLSAGQFTSSSNKDGVAKTVTIDKPNTITYNVYLPSFCRTLTDSNNPLYKEFSSIEIHGNNPLSEKFEKSSCEEYKLKGQIQFMFK
jgi:hypothetical protein